MAVQAGLCLHYLVVTNNEDRFSRDEAQITLINEPEHNKTVNKTTSPPSEEPHQPAQSDQSLRCPPEKGLGPRQPIECQAKTLIRLGGCPG